MPPFFTRNRILVGQLLLCFYMLGAVQAPVLGLVHFISHSIIDHDHNGLHSYADHDNDSHSLISFVDKGEEEDNKQKHLIQTPDNKVEYLNQVPSALTKFDENNSIIEDYTRHLVGIRPETPSPPPESKA